MSNKIPNQYYFGSSDASLQVVSGDGFIRFRSAWRQGLPPIYWEGISPYQQGQLVKDLLFPPEAIIQRLAEDCSEESSMEERSGPEIEQRIWEE
jgi:hypothetical protein